MTQTYGPYSSSYTAHGFVYTAGQIGAINGNAATDIKTQTMQALQNLKQVLEAAGTSLQNVVKTTVFLTDMNHFAAMNECYAQVFAAADCAPARSCVAVAELPRVADKPLLIEIEAVATLSAVVKKKGPA